MTNQVQAIVTNTNNTLTTTSVNIADVFGKLHKNVIQSIANLQADLPQEWYELNFQPVEYTDAKGEKRPAYNITRDGFTLLAMGFTGKKALSFKLAYIDQFNAMEKALNQRLTLTPEQQRFVQKAVNIKVKATGEHWNTIYHNIKDVFNVGTYTDIKQETFPALCEYLGVIYEGEYIPAGTPEPTKLTEPTPMPTPSVTIHAQDFNVKRTEDWHKNFQQGQEAVNAIRQSVCTGDAKLLDKVKYAMRNAQSAIYQVNYCGDGISVGYIDMITRYAMIGMQACNAPLTANLI